MPSNISVFVPHNGCPNMCSFCNQFAITSHHYQPTEADVDAAVKTAVRSMGAAAKLSEIAFFGGSFTAINRDYMVSLLRAAHKYVVNGTVRGVRISTRPDAISEEILEILSKYGVTTIELGAQSMTDSVLSVNLRGHTAEDVRMAARLIKDRGFALGLQMMTGLYTDTDEGVLCTAQEFIKLVPDCVRIYPTVVLRGTRLAELYLSGEYKPQTVEEAVELCSKLLTIFCEKNIPVIRLGLHSIDESEFVSGAWHPSFGELCESRLMLKRIRTLTESGKNYIIAVPPRDLSKAIGNKKCNIIALKAEGINIKVIADVNLCDGEISAEEVNQIEVKIH